MKTLACFALLLMILAGAPADGLAQRAVTLSHESDGIHYSGAGPGLDVASLQQLEFALEYDPDLVGITALVPSGILAENAPDQLQIDYLAGRVEVFVAYDAPVVLGDPGSSVPMLFEVLRAPGAELYQGERVAVRTLGRTPGTPPRWIDALASPDDIKVGVVDLVIVGDGITCLAGDALGDGRIGAGDASAVLRISVDLIESPDVALRCGADFNRDGYVHAGDGVLILRRAAGFDDTATRVEANPTIELVETDTGARLRISDAGFAHGASLRVRAVGAVTLKGLDAGSSALGARRVEGEEARIALADVEPIASDVLEFSIEAEGTGRIVVDEILLFGAGGEALFQGADPVSLDLSGTPAATRMALGNTPNPFNPSTTFWMELPREGRVVVDLYDMRGRRLATLLDEVRPGGRSTFRFESGDALPSGVYFARMRAAGRTVVERITLLK